MLAVPVAICADDTRSGQATPIRSGPRHLMLVRLMLVRLAVISTGDQAAR